MRVAILFMLFVPALLELARHIDTDWMELVSFDWSEVHDISGRGCLRLMGGQRRDLVYRRLAFTEVLKRKTVTDDETHNSHLECRGLIVGPRDIVFPFKCYNKPVRRVLYGGPGGLKEAKEYLFNHWEVYVREDFNLYMMRFDLEMSGDKHTISCAGVYAHMKEQNRKMEVAIWGRRGAEYHVYGPSPKPGMCVTEWNKACIGATLMAKVGDGRNLNTPIGMVIDRAEEGNIPVSEVQKFTPAIIDWVRSVVNGSLRDDRVRKAQEEVRAERLMRKEKQEREWNTFLFYISSLFVAILGLFLFFAWRSWRICVREEEEKKRRDQLRIEAGRERWRKRMAAKYKKD